MSIVGMRIRKLRDEKGITQELMAIELNMTQSNYGRLEKDGKRLTAAKLLEISRVLEAPISKLFGEQTNQIINQHNNESPNAYNVEILHQTNKNAYSLLW